MNQNTSAEPNRVRANTAEELNNRIDRTIEESVCFYSGRSEGEVRRRIYELEREWDIERVLETMASSFSLTGIALGLTTSKRWFLFPTVVLSFLLMHAIQGWCPPVPVLRRLGVRTREEIERERYGLKALIGEGAANSEHHASVTGDAAQAVQDAPVHVMRNG
jgi:hypothetical protein